MARSRNIKPGFFTNDELAELEPLARILFIGIWTIADYKGDLLKRSKKIKAQILPYDNCDVEKLMINLFKSRFITIYNVNGESYAHINKFAEHQNPHPNEKKKGSNIPEYSPELAQVIDSKEVAINHDKSRLNQDYSITDPADSLILNPSTLIPDSPILIPETGNLNPSKTIVELKHDHAQDVFKFWQETMSHHKAAYDDKRKALIRKQLKHYSADDLKKAIHGCSLTPHNMGDNDRGEKYDSIELILREAKQIDRFMANADNPPAGKVTTIQQTQDRAKAQADRIKKHLGWTE